MWGFISGLVFLLDEGIKHTIEKIPKMGPLRELWNGRVILWKYHNYGAFYNLGQTKKAAVTVVSVAFTVLLSVFFVVTLGRCGNKTLKAGLAFLLGGAFSNTYDRLARKYVVDYIQLPKVPGVRKIIWNIADLAIAIGALFVVSFYQLQDEKERLEEIA